MLQITQALQGTALGLTDRTAAVGGGKLVRNTPLGVQRVARGAFQLILKTARHPGGVPVKVCRTAEAEIIRTSDPKMEVSGTADPLVQIRRPPAEDFMRAQDAPREVTMAGQGEIQRAGDSPARVAPTSSSLSWEVQRAGDSPTGVTGGLACVVTPVDRRGAL